jgi:hypothetical protein
LLPGRGIPGVAADGALGAAAAGAAGAAGAAAAGASSVAFAAAFLAAGAAGTAEAGAAGVAEVSSTGASALAAAFLAGAFLGASSFGFASGNASLSFFATGGAIVDEPLFTNSPSSASLAKATLESIPSSLAMSYTRGSATYFSCLGPSPRQGRPLKLLGTHFELLIFCQHRFCLFFSEYKT